MTRTVTYTCEVCGRQSGSAIAKQVIKDAIKNLNDFEAKHQLTGKTIPNLC